MGSGRTSAPDFSREERIRARPGGLASGPICGIDEAGRGPWAGPVVAAAVILDGRRAPDGIDDSKKLSAPRRTALAEAIRAAAVTGIGIASVEEIDALNIREATFLAMRRAVAALAVVPAHALIDGRDAPDVGCPAEAVTGGDGLSLSIAAASILAKTARDGMMAEAARRYPGYGFERHMGYGTKAHRAALARLGACPLHRKSFAPIRALDRKMLSPGPAQGLDLVSVNQG